MSAEEQPIFAARDVSKRFRGLTALSGINFQLKRGEVLGLIGPNGAGKTTLISLISGTSVSITCRRINAPSWA